MKRFQTSLFLLLVLWLIPHSAHAQAWSGIIDPSRAINWSGAGTTIVEPTNQCGPTISAMGSSGAPVSPTAINNAIGACTGGGYVLLGSGTFYLNSCIQFWNGNGWNSNVVLRGQGANSTFLIFSGSSVGCGGQNSAIVLEGQVTAPGQEGNMCDWTAGYAKGSTSITLSNCGSTTPAMGTLSNLTVGSLLVLDQLDEPSDTGTIWNCAVNGVCADAGTGGFTRGDGPCLGGGVCWRSQAQGVVVTSVNQSTGVMGITPPLYMPNWRSSQLPQAWFGTRFVTGDAVENLSIDTTNVTGLGHTISILDCYRCWVSGVRSIDAPRSHVAMYMAWHSVVKDSYFYQGQSHGAVSYGVEEEYAWDNLVQNNICQQITDSCPNSDGDTEGNVAAYNFSVDNVYTSPGWFQASFYQHASGDAFDLSEGNVGTGYNADDIHGTHNFETLFRNYLPGQQPAGCDGAPCSLQTNAINLNAGVRYFNVVGNVLGTPGYHNNYQCVALSTAPCQGGNGTQTIYTLGYTGNGGSVLNPGLNYCSNPACSSTVNYDPQVSAYLFRWGNYDTVTGAARWCGNSSSPGWSTTCGNTSEVPASLAAYSNAVPSSTALPPSLYLSSKPSWFGGIPFPAIGPDVTGGNLLSVANMIPAQNCFVNIMGGPANGAGNVLSFNASACYGSTSASAPAPPTGVTATVQ
jgi:hypothetical protein